MATAEAIKETVDTLNARDALFAEWKRTPESDHGTLARICVELDGLFHYRADWSRKHPKSYLYATGKGLIRRKAGLNQWYGNIPPPDTRSLQAKIAETRTWLHEWCVAKKVGYHDEQYAGDLLIRLMNEGTSQADALKDAKLSVKIGQ